MLRALAAGFLGLLLLSAPAGAATVANFEVNNTGDLVALCAAKETAKGGLYDDAVMFCYGFMMGYSE